MDSYAVDGSFESYSRLMRDAERGVPGALEAIEWYRQYQELSRDVRLNRIPPPDSSRFPVGSPPWGPALPPAQPFHGKELLPAPREISENWSIQGEPSEDQLKELRGALDKMLPRPPYAPPGVTIASHQRIGDEIRNTYLDHLGAMFSGGSIDQAEYEARSDAAVRARTKEELEFLIQDLPLVVVKKEPAEAVKKEFTDDDWLSRLPGQSMAGVMFLLFSILAATGMSTGVVFMVIASGLALLWFAILLAKTFRKH